jgi:hypothetical protein
LLDLSRHTENSHVKTNLVHTLHRVNKYGVLPLPSFKDLITRAEYKKCESNPKKSWFNLTAEVFAAFLFRVSSNLNLIASKY